MLSKRLRKAFKGELKNLRLEWRRQSGSFSPRDLHIGIASLGVCREDTLFVHSSHDRFEGFTGKPTNVNHILQEVVSDGTLLMPTLSFGGTAVEYVAQAKVFDVKRTPSQMGLLTELFRREPGVLRSVHPTHSVAAWGRGAAAMIANHHLATTPCGRATPYQRLLNNDGKILFLGTDISVMTFFHYLEADLESRMPFSPFTREVFTLISKDWDGKELVTRTRLYDPQYSKRRNLQKLIPVLKADASWHESRVGTVNLILLGAWAVHKACNELAQRGVYCYDAI